MFEEEPQDIRRMVPFESMFDFYGPLDSLTEESAALVVARVKIRHFKLVIGYIDAADESDFLLNNIVFGEEENPLVPLNNAYISVREARKFGMSDSTIKEEAAEKLAQLKAWEAAETLRRSAYFNSTIAEMRSSLGDDELDSLHQKPGPITRILGFFGLK